MHKNDFLARFYDSTIQFEKDGFPLRVKDFINHNTYQDYEKPGRVFRLELNSATSQWEVWTRSTTRSRRKASKASDWALVGTGKAVEKFTRPNTRQWAKKQRTEDGASSSSSAPRATLQNQAHGAAGVAGVAGQEQQQNSQQQQQQQQQQQRHADSEGGSKKGSQEEGQEGRAADNAVSAEQAVQEMGLMDMAALIHDLRYNPPRAYNKIAHAFEQHSETYKRAGLGLDLQEGGASAGCSESALELLDSVAFKAKERMQQEAPDLVIFAGPPSSGKSSLANQLMNDFFPKDIANQNQSGSALISGPTPKGTDTSDPHLSVEEQGFLFSKEVPLPDLNVFEEDDLHPFYTPEEDEVFPIPKGSGSGGVTGAPILVHFLVVPTKPSNRPYKVLVRLDNQSAQEVTHALEAVAEEAAKEGDGESAGALQRVRAMFGLKEDEDLPSNPAERRLPWVYKFQALESEFDASHPDCFRLVHRVLKRYTQVGLWGMVKAAHVYVPSTLALPSIMDAPGLTSRDPFRLKLVQDAVRMHPSFALVVLKSSRQGDDGLEYNIRELELPGALKANGSSLSWLPLKVYLWYNIMYEKPKRSLRNFLGHDQFHGPNAAYRSLLPELIRSHEHDPGLQEAMLKQTEAGPIFLNEENKSSSILEKDLKEPQAAELILKNKWEDSILRDRHDAHQLHALVVLKKEIAPDLPYLFEAFEADITSLETNNFHAIMTKTGMDDLCGRFRAVLARLRDEKSKLLESKTQTRAGAGAERNVPEKLRAKVGQEKAHLLRDCSAEAFKKREDTARRLKSHRLHGLVKKNSRQLGVALVTKCSEVDMPLSLPELALGDTMAIACNRIRDLAHTLIGQHLVDHHRHVMTSVLKEEISHVRTAAFSAARKRQQPGEESESTAISRAITVFEQLAERHLRTIHTSTLGDLASAVERMRPENEDSALWQLRAYDSAMHDDAVELKDSTRGNEPRLNKLKELSRPWGERVVSQILDHFVSDSETSVWSQMRAYMALRSDNALADLGTFVRDIKKGKPLSEDTRSVPLSQALRKTRLLVAQNIVALEDAAHGPTSPTQPNYAAQLHRLTSYTGLGSELQGSVGGSGQGAAVGAAGSSQATDAGAAALLLSLTADDVPSTSKASTSAAQAPEPTAGGVQGAGSSGGRAQSGRGGSRVVGTGVGSTLERARELLRQQDTMASNEAGAAQEGTCCLCKEPHKCNHSIKKLLTASPPLRRLAGTQTMLCKLCHDELSKAFTGSFSDLRDEDNVSSAWEYVRLVRGGMRHAKAQSTAKRRRA